MLATWTQLGFSALGVVGGFGIIAFFVEHSSPVKTLLALISYPLRLVWPKGGD